MPRQSRGFWVCSYCEQAFDQFEQADVHEKRSCPMVAAVADPHSAIPPPWQQQQQQPPHHQQQYQQPPPPTAATGMAPLSASERQGGQAPYQQQLQQQPQPKPLQRYLPLMGSQEPSHLNAADTLACRSTELFEVTEGTTTSSSGSNPGQLGQVGLRCAFCAESPQTQASYTFPPNTRAVGTFVRQQSFDHLATCPHFPHDYKQQIQDAIASRRQAVEGSAAAQQEEGHRRAMSDFCATRCQQAGIVDRHPVGMSFADTGIPLVPIGQPPPPGYGGQQRPRYSGTQQQRPYAYRPPTSYSGSSGAPPPAGYGMPPPPPQYGQQQQPPPPPSQYGQMPLPIEQNMPPSRGERDEEPDRLAPGPRYQQPPFSPVPSDFPFFYEQNRWVCKFCSHLPPPYRDPQYFWADNGPPPGNFVDHHLSICREFQKGMMYDQQQQQQQPLPAFPPGAHARSPMASPSFGQPTPGWEQQQQRAMVPATPTRSEYHPSSPAGHVVSSPYSPSYQRSPGPSSAIVQSSPNTKAGASDMDAARAIEYLEANDLSKFDNDGNLVTETDMLILDEDRLLLTEYFFYLMKQLRLVRFSEADRRTRGGKREKIKVGYGGLQCVHCVDIPNTRKFFWSNVDRLANSFAEIPGHVLKCRRCPQPTKDALLLLKQRHPEQMSRLPRGSQKVFFRRMWRRLHDEDPVDPATGAPPPIEYSPTPQPQMPRGGHSSHAQQHHAAASSPLGVPTTTMRPPPLDTKPAALPASAAAATAQPSKEHSPSVGTSGSDESAYFLQRPAKEAAKALLDASMQPGPPSPSSRVLLAIPEDKEWLSDTDCFIRRQLEVFCATVDDVEEAKEDRKYPVKPGQIGIRCIHCALTKGARGQAVAYPFSISGVYEAAREFQRLHLETCENLPLSAKTKLVSLKGAASLSSVLRKYFVLAAKALGLKDSSTGIRAGAESVAIGGQAAFAFSEGMSPMSDEMMQQQRSSADPASRKKRKAADAPYGGDSESKRAAVVGAESRPFQGSPLPLLPTASSSSMRDPRGETKDDAKKSDEDDPSQTEAI